MNTSILPYRAKLVLTLACSLIAGTALASHAWAQDVSANERKGIDISGKWRGTRGLVTRGDDGKVVFLYGEVQPSVVCSPLQVCDIELQPGEVVRDVLAELDLTMGLVGAASIGDITREMLVEV